MMNVQKIPLREISLNPVLSLRVMFLMKNMGEEILFGRVIEKEERRERERERERACNRYS